MKMKHYILKYQQYYFGKIFDYFEFHIFSDFEIMTIRFDSY
jgi:hypothetical protein